MKTLNRLILAVSTLAAGWAFAPGAEAASLVNLGTDSALIANAAWKKYADTSGGFEAEARIGDRGGAATFELDVGRTTSGPFPAQGSTAQFNWVNGTNYAFSLVVSGTTATWTMDTAGTPTAISFDFGSLQGFNALVLRMAAPGDTGTDNVTLSDLKLGTTSYSFPGPSASYTHEASSSSDRTLNWGLIAGSDLSAGFTLTGTLKFAWDSTVPGQSNLAMQIKGYNVVPVPAALPLMLSALAGLGLIARRRASAT